MASPLFFPHRNDNSIGSVVPVDDLSSGEGNNPVHLFRHFISTEKTVFLADRHGAETCPHVLIAPSAVSSIVYVNSYTFSHIFRVKAVLAG